jgi:hypothetical protein
MIHCPYCNKENTDGVDKCSCGYYFNQKEYEINQSKQLSEEKRKIRSASVFFIISVFCFISAIVSFKLLQGQVELFTRYVIIIILHGLSVATAYISIKSSPFQFQDKPNKKSVFLIYINCFFIVLFILRIYIILKI